MFPWGPEGSTCLVGIVMGGPLCDREFLGLTETTLQTSQSCQDMSRSMAKFTEQIRIGWEQICQVCQLTTVLPKIDQQLTHIQIQDTETHMMKGLKHNHTKSDDQHLCFYGLEP